jgi:hypothetical protein
VAGESKALVPVEQKSIEFCGDDLMAVCVQLEGQSAVYVPVRPICDYLGLEWLAQYRRISRDPILSSELIACVVVMATQGQPDQRREMLCLPLDRVNGFLLGINANRVRQEVRDRLVQYQRECYHALADAFVSRAQPNDWARTRTETVAALQQIREDMLAVVRWANEEIERISPNK